MRTLVLLCALFAVMSVAHADEFNAGIVQGLWYSSDTVFATQPVRIYVAIRNNTGKDLSGNVEFFDGDRKIGHQSVQALNGRIIESWTDWTPAYGTHTISASLSRIELHNIGSSTQEVAVTSALAKDTVFADLDTDKDGIGNQKDMDDDGDGESDADEQKNHTDPLVKNKKAVAEPDTGESPDAEAAPKTSDAPEGLERYLAEGSAQDTLSSVSTFINEAKTDLDAYRTAREEKKEAVSSTQVSADGFGTVSRSTSTAGKPLHSLSLEDFFVSVFKLAKTIFNAVYTLLLAVLSTLLGHPIFIQVGILLCILLLLLKFASKFGRRPKH